MASRAFELKTVVIIDDSDIVDPEYDDPSYEVGDLTLSEVRDHLDNALMVDINSEDYLNTIGLTHAQAKLSTLREIDAKTVLTQYGLTMYQPLITGEPVEDQ